MNLVWTPHVTVAAVIEQDGRFLLVRERSGGRLVFNQPAGHLEDRESLLQAVVRETLEETAWQFTPEAIVGIYRWRHPGKQETYMRVTFTGRGTLHQPARALDPDIEQVVWLDMDEVRQRHAELRSPLVLRSIEDYLAGARYPLALLADVD
ncbi:MAG: NUDIX hydrolase [Thiohalobacterales bacterium]|nr:NUDIX hydrolase [Thiohalobacterales bacterium]